MEDAGLYVRHNSLQRQGIEVAIRAHWPSMQWSEEGERALDVGCGTGDVTAMLLLPSMPPNSTIVGIDVSSKMVEFAKSNYGRKNVQFKTVDFSEKNITRVLQAQSFSKIFSFYCFHWILDQQQVAQNVLELLRPGGEFLFVTAPTSQVFSIYRIMAKMDRWKPYMHDVDSFTPCFNGSKDACGEMRRTLESAGLEVKACDLITNTVTFASMRTFMSTLEAFDPFVCRMSDTVRREYMACFERVCDQYWPNKPTPSGTVPTHNPILIIYGSKPVLAA